MLVSKNKWIKKTLEKAIPNVFNFFHIKQNKIILLHGSFLPNKPK